MNPIVGMSRVQSRPTPFTLPLASKISLISLWVNGLNLDLQLNQAQLDSLTRLGQTQSKLAQAQAMLTSLRSEISFALNDPKHKPPNELTIDVDAGQKEFLNQVLIENGSGTRLVNSTISVNDLVYFTGQVERWMGTSDMRQQALNSEVQFTAQQYSNQLQLIDKVMNSTYDIFWNVIKTMP